MSRIARRGLPRLVARALLTLATLSTPVFAASYARADEGPSPPPPPPVPPPIPPPVASQAEPPVRFKLTLPEGSLPLVAAVNGKDPDTDYTTRRFEPAGFPLLGGDSDIGFQFGGVATLSRFGDGIRPYAWNMDVGRLREHQGRPTGVEFVQESFL